MKLKCLETSSKFMQPLLETEIPIECMTDEEKINFIKEKFNLSHGKGKRKKKRKG